MEFEGNSLVSGTDQCVIGGEKPTSVLFLEFLENLPINY